MDGLSLWRQQFYRNVKFCDFLVFMNKGPLHFMKKKIFTDKNIYQKTDQQIKK